MKQARAKPPIPLCSNVFCREENTRIYWLGGASFLVCAYGESVLIGLNAKNAILIVEYAKMNMENGEPVVKAALDAARLRLRPILMTSFAFILGCVPLAIATGPGAGARVSMGNAVVGGMTFATMIGIFMIPVLFVVVERIFNRKKHSEE